MLSKTSFGRLNHVFVPTGQSVGTYTPGSGKKTEANFPQNWLSLKELKRLLLTQDVVLTSIQRHLNVMDVRWTSKQRCVLTGVG